ncbi:plasmid mobilization relaxosome protein MobC [Methylobacterium komagatae]|uniref:Plasmid mobilization relaxosome protein MobC n=1 Tax=Methylobacterium komagatae TaxID=374425 RepID=A0ABW2BSM5_9HYPH
MDAARRRTGRPRKPAPDLRAAWLPAARVTARERQAIEEKAARAGLDMSEFVRRAALGQTVRPRPTADADRLLVELNRIGNNLNQITARMHLTGELSFSMAATLAELRGAMAKVAAYDP